MCRLPNSTIWASKVVVEGSRIKLFGVWHKVAVSVTVTFYLQVQSHMHAEETQLLVTSAERCESRASHTQQAAPQDASRLFP